MDQFSMCGNHFSRIFFTLILALSLCGVNAQSVWTGASDSDWSNAANWAGGVPSAGSSVNIPGTPAGGNFPVYAESPVFTFNVTNAGTLTFGSVVYHTGSIINYDGASIVSNDYFINAGSITFDNDGDLTNNGVFDNYGTLDNALSATLTNAAGATFNNFVTLKNNGTVINNGLLNNYGTFRSTQQFLNNGSLSNEGNIEAPFGSSFAHITGASFANHNSGDVTINGTFAIGSPITNDGIFSIQSSSNATNSSTITNNGELAISGTLTNNSTITNNNTILLKDGGTLENKNNLTNNNTINLSVCGVLVQDAGNNIGGTILSDGAIYTLNGTVANASGEFGVVYNNLGQAKPPVAGCRSGAVVTLNANGNGSLNPNQVDKGSYAQCGPAISSVTLSQSNFSTADLGAQSVTLTVTDDNGNASTCDAVIFVVEPAESITAINDPNIVSDCPDDILESALTGAATATVSWTEPTATTSCTTGGNEPGSLSINSTVTGSGVTTIGGGGGGEPDCSASTNSINGLIFLGEYNNSKYFCTDGNQYTWHEAKALAESKGGRLAIINDAQENDWVQSQILADYVWIGYTDEASEGNFQWIGGNSSYTQWSSGEPNNSGGTEHYARLLKSNGNWTDRNGSFQAEGLFEFPCTITTTSGGNTDPCASNILTNPGFENGGADWNNWGASVAISYAPNVHTGNKSMRIYNGEGGFGQWAAATAGQTYGLSLQAKITESPSWAGAGIEFFDADWNSIQNTTIDYDVNNFEYVQYSTTAVAPANAAYVQAWFWKSGTSGRVFIDEVCLGPIGGGSTGGVDCANAPEVDGMMYIGTFEGSHYYKKPDGDLQYADAKAFIEARGGTLPIINSQAEQDFLYDLNPNGGYWLGLTDEAQEGTFVWADGSSLDYSNWNSGEPNDYGTGEDYSAVRNDGTWNDTKATKYNWAILELPCGSIEPQPSCANAPSVDGMMFIGTLGNSHYYKKPDGDLKFLDARAFVEARGGTLPIINSQEEQDFLFGLNPNGGYWLGLTDEAQEGTFVWADGSALGYSNWNAGEPNDWNTGEDFAHVRNNGTWNDASANSIKWAIMELPCGSNGGGSNSGTDCSSVLVQYNMDACESFGGTPSPNDYSEFTPSYPSTGNCSNVSATGVFRNSGAHSCIEGYNGSGGAACFGVHGLTSFQNDSDRAIRFEITLNPNQAGQLTGLKFREMAPDYFHHLSGNSGTNNYPKKYGVRVTKNGQEIFKETNLNTTTSWSLESFDFSNLPEFSVTSTTTFKFELLSYDAVNNGGQISAWDIDQIQIEGGCCTAETCESIDVTFQNNGPDAAKVYEVNNGNELLIATLGNGQSTVQTTVEGQEYIVRNDSGDAEENFVATGCNNYTVTIDAEDAGGGVIPCNDITVQQIAGIANGGDFPIGTTTIAYEFKDCCDNIEVCTFEVTVEETPAEITFSCNDDIVVDAPACDDSGVAISWTAPTASSTCYIAGVEVNRTDDGPANGGIFPIGTTTVTYVALDSCNNAEVCNFNVTVNYVPGDLSITCNDNITLVLQPGQTSTVVNYGIPTGTTTAANGQVEVSKLSGPDSGASLTVGMYEVVYLITDDCNNTEVCSFKIVIGSNASLGDKVFTDLDGDGVQDPNEPGIEGIVVMLLDPATGDMIGQTTTLDDGSYLFTNLQPGDYKVKFPTNPTVGGQEYTLTAPNQGTNDATDSDAVDMDGITAMSQVVTLTPGDENLTIDAGYEPVIEPAKLGDTVFADLDGDGIQDPNEPGIDGIVVMLLNPTTGAMIAQTTTTNGGTYEFADLEPGDYKVKFPTNPTVGGQEYTLTVPNQGTNDATDSDAVDMDGITAMSQVITLAPGDDDPTIDAGYEPVIEPAKLGDTVFADLDGDGIQDPNEPGIDGIVVMLLNPTTGAMIAQTTTTNGGSYEFAGLAPGDYKVKFPTNPTAGGQEYTLTAPNQGTNDATDSDAVDMDGITAMSQVVTLAPGDDDPTIDAGYEPVIEPAKLGDTVFADLDGDGIQDPNEPGIDDIVVMLLDPTTGDMIAQTTTTNGGTYEFAGLAPGDYKVKFPTNPTVGGQEYTLTAPNQGTNDATDSDAVDMDGITAMSQVVTLAPGDDDPTIDAGYEPVIEPAKLGDTVFADLDGDGIQDPNEPGIDGIVVMLLDPTTGDMIAQTTTTNGGTYEFAGLAPGDYKVKFPTNPTVGGQEYTLTVPNQGTNDATDSDAVDMDGITAMSQVVTLAPGDDDPTIDAGYEPVIEPAKLGDTVFADLDGDGIQDPNEPGIQGVTVTLLDGNGNFLDDTTTGPNGEYGFDNLPAGDYKVKFPVTAASNGVAYNLTTPNQGGNDATDSDAVIMTGTNMAMSQVVTLIPGDDNPTIDAGYVPSTAEICAERVVTNVEKCSGLTAGQVYGGYLRLENLDFFYSFENGTLTQYTDGTATLSGTWVNNTDPSITFDVSFDLSGKTTSPGAEAPKPHACLETVEGAQYYYESFTGTLTGTNAVEGAVIAVSQFGPSLQVGMGGNLTDNIISFGASAWFDGSIISQPTNGPALVLDVDPGGQIGDINIRLSGSIEPCMDCVDSDGDGVCDDVDICAAGDDFADADFDGIPDACDDNDDEVCTVTPASNLVKCGFNAGNEYGLWLLIKGQYYFYSMSEGVFTENTNGTAQLVGTFTNLTNPTFGFEALVNFSGRTAVGNPYPHSCLTADGSDYYYYSQFGGTLSGINDAAGAVIIIEDFGGPFQVGVGANGTDQSLTFGASGWFNGYVATQPTNGTTIQMDPIEDGRIGDFNFRLTPNTPNGINDYGDDDGDGIPNACDEVEPASLGDFVFADLDGDGVQDANEPGIGGITVILLDATTGEEVGTTTTLADGSYEFTGLEPGTYKVKFPTNPTVGGQEYTLTAPNQGTNDATDSDAVDMDGVMAMSQPVTLEPGDNDPTIDAGYEPVIEPARLGDFVFVDLDEDGVQDPNEPGIQGIVVMLLDPATGAMISQTTTLADGSYEFAGLAPGDYKVKFPTNPTVGGQEYILTAPNQGTNDATDSDAVDMDGITAMSQVVTLAPGDNDPTIDAGYTPVIEPARLGDFVFVDLDEDGVQDPNEPGIQGIVVMLLDPATGAMISQTTTLADGSYEFAGLAPGDYKVKFPTNPTVGGQEYNLTAPNQGTNDATDSDAVDMDGITAMSQVVTLAPGDNDPTIDAGYTPVIEPASLGDFVFADLDEDGVQDPNEPGIQGIVVMLLDPATGDMIAQTTTLADGSYEFAGLAPGDYKVKFPTNPTVGGQEYNLTAPNQGGNDATDSDAVDMDGITAMSQVVTLAPGDNDPTIDAGYTPVIEPASLGDFVFADLDEDGVQDPNEPGIQGIVVMLLDPATGAMIAQTTTLADGSYEFAGLAPGDYKVKFPTNPTVGGQEYNLTAPNQGGNDATDSDAVDMDGITAMSQVVTLAPGDNNPTIDAGYTPVIDDPCVGPGSLSEIVTVETQNPICAESGSITFNFPDTPGRTQIAFSLDGGSTWKANVLDNIGSKTYADLAAGTYELMVRWGNTDCPTDLGSVVINGNGGSPIVTVTSTDVDCEGNGSITFAFDNHPTRTQIAFSFDGGNSYLANVSDAIGSITYDDFSVGTYELAVRWGNTECPTELGTINIVDGCELEVCADRDVTNVTLCNGSNAGTSYGGWLRNDEYTNFFDVQNSTLVEYTDGTATLTGTWVNLDNPGIVFDIVLNATGKTDVAPGEIKPHHCLSPNEEAYYFYSDFTATLTGSNLVDGLVIELAQFGAALQLGLGANVSDSQISFGASAWFSGTVVSPATTGFTFTLNPSDEGHLGDVNIRLSGNPLACCDCTDSDNDNVCDQDDICNGFDDNVDTDGDGIPDGCDTVDPVCDGQVTGFQINDGGNMIDFVEGQTFCESDFSTDIRIRTLQTGTHQSLRFTITSPNGVHEVNTENVETYDSKAFWANPGTYTVNVKLYNEDNLGGDLCDEKTITFVVEDCSSTNPVCDGQVTGFQINDGGTMIDFTEGQTFCESDFSTDIRIRTLQTGTHQSLRFTITSPNGVNEANTENVETYDSRNFWANPGTYTVNVKLYSEDNLGGNLCDEQTITFVVEDCSASNSCDNSLLVNGDFEDGLNGWSINNPVNTTSNVNSGVGAAKIGSRSGGIWQFVPAEPGQLFELRAFAKTFTTSWTAIGLSFFDADGVKIAQEDQKITSSEYEEMIVQATAPANTVTVKAWVWKSGSSNKTFVDDICLISTNNGGWSASISQSLAFEAEKDGRSVKLNWATNTEYKNDYFIVEHSLDGQNWEEMLEITSKSSSTTMTQYTDSDDNPYYGDNYYRIKQIFNDGGWVYTNEQKVTFDIDLSTIAVFPNPTAKDVYLGMGDYIGQSAVIKVMNHLGQQMDEIKVEELSIEPVKIDVSNYNSGYYFIYIELDGTRNITKKFIKSNL